MRPQPRPPSPTPERLAYWYFRLNGFMTIENFIVHPDRGADVRTDVDILASRFKYRRENVLIPMMDDPKVAECETLINVILAEIKTGDCALNGPWTRPERGNMARVLRAVGCTAPEELDKAAQDLQRSGRWSDGEATIRLFAFGERAAADLDVGVEQQIEWESVINFCIQRFGEYRRQKSAIGQWTRDGKLLRSMALRRDRSAIRRQFGLTVPS